MRELISGDVVSLLDYDNKTYEKFCEDMDDAGIECQHYSGRFFYEGPAAIVDNIQDALSNTKVPCIWDGMGLSYVVYPG